LTVQTENTNKGSLSCSRLPRVRARVDLSRSSIYDLIAKGKFPRPIKLGVRSVGWLDSEIEEWIRGRVEASRGGGMQGAMTILALVDLLDARRAGRGRFMARCA
jgi:prophage regulatory protein